MSLYQEVTSVIGHTIGSTRSHSLSASKLTVSMVTQTGAQRNMVRTFPNWQNSLTLLVFFPFVQYFLMFLFYWKFIRFIKFSILGHFIYASLKITNNIFLKFPDFSNILCDFLWLFPVFCVIFSDFFQYLVWFSPTFSVLCVIFPDWKMPFYFVRFSSLTGN